MTVKQSKYRRANCDVVTRLRNHLAYRLKKGYSKTGTEIMPGTNPKVDKGNIKPTKTLKLRIKNSETSIDALSWQ